MADNYYKSKYSGDQIDGAVAVLGGLKALTITKAEFDAFANNYNEKLAAFIESANSKFAGINGRVKILVASEEEIKCRVTCHD